MAAGNTKKKTANSKISQVERTATGRIAQMIALRCVRNTSIEEIHAGKSPRSQVGDYSDVKVVTPFGEIPWNDVSRITNEEMKRFNTEVVNKLFTVLLCLSRQEMPVGSHAFYVPAGWDDPEIDPGIAGIFERANDE